MSGKPSDYSDGRFLDALQKWRGRGASLFLQKLLGRRGAQLAYGILFVGALSLFGWLIHYLLFAPKRTAVIALAATTYEWPLPPHAWSREDVQDLDILDGESIGLLGARQDTLDWAAIQRRLQQDKTDRRVVRAHTVICYVAMHGVAKELNQPQLIPPRGSVLDPESWIDVRELLNEVQEALPQKNVLVVFDCDRIQVNWNLGFLYNSFASALEQFWTDNKNDFPRLVILNSTGPDQPACVSRELSGSVFGYYLRLGLAGVADDDGNRSISLSELDKYLTEHVSQWAATQRGVAQQPMFLPGTTNADFEVARSLKRSSLLAVRQRTDRRGMAIAPDELDQLWSWLEVLRRDHRPYRYEPQQWAHLEHQLLWLEQLSTSGTAYDQVAREVAAILHRDLRVIRGRMAQLSEQRDVASHARPISGQPWTLPKLPPSHSLYLADYLAQLKPEVTDDLRLQRSEFIGSPGRDSLAKVLRVFAETPLPELVEQRFLNMLQRYQHPELWRASAQLVRLAELRDRAEALAVPREVDGAPGDERAHHWVRRDLAAADQARRDAEDRLFIVGQPQLVDDLQAADVLYNKAAQRQQQITGALELRDDVFAQILHLARWLTHPALIKDDVNKGNDLTRKQVLPLIGEAFDLARAISDDDGDPQRINNLGAPVARRMANLIGALNDEVKRLVEPEQNSPRSLGRIDAVLEVPLILAADRRALLRNRAAIAERLHDKNQDNRARLDGGAAIDTEERYVTRADAWGKHPVLAVISPTIAAQQPDLHHFDLRFLDRAFDTVARKLAPENQKPLSQRWPQLAARVSRSDWSTIEHVTRATAPIWFLNEQRSFSRLGSALSDPIASLREIDVQRLLLWHAERSLTDFWGAAGQKPSFFDVATADYLQAAKQVSASRTPRAIGKLEALTEQLRERREIAPKLLKPVAEGDVVIEAGDEAIARVIVNQQTELASVNTVIGTATMIVRDSGTRLPTSTVRLTPASVPLLPGETTEVQVAMDPAELARSRQQLWAEAMFRGHEFQDRFLLRPLGGARTSFLPHVYEQTRVTLYGPDRGLSVVFVLDCSHSMRPHLDIAKKAINGMLFNLAMRGNARVGVYLFGHRVGWTTDKPIVPRIQPTYPFDLPSDLTPNEDVERISSLAQPFDLTALPSVAQRINRAVAWGQSPLYLSLVRGLNEIRDTPGDYDQHVVVVTDGMNYQFFPSGQDNQNVGSSTGYQDVMRAWQSTQIPIHIIGLSMNGSQARQSVAEFKRLTQQTDGQYHALDSTLNLSAALEELFAPGVYNIEDSAGNPVQPVSTQLGTSIDVPIQPNGLQAHDVRFERLRKRIQLQGGEAVELYVADNDRSIHAFPFEQNVAAWAWLESTNDRRTTNHLLRAHHPFRQQADAVFPISLQRLDDDFPDSAELLWTTTVRPAEVWIEITPLADASDKLPTYFFYDANYEPNKPVPLLNLVARSWPANASRATIEFWCKPVPTDERAIPWGRERAALEVSPGVILQTEAGFTGKAPGEFRIRVVERHEKKNDQQVDWLKVAPPSLPNLRPLRIRRQFDAEAGIAAHWFYYSIPDPQLEDALRNGDLNITTRSAALADSWQSEQERLIVDIVQAGELIELVNE